MSSSACPAGTDLHVVTFDIETRRLADEVGGWAALKRGAGGISALVIHDSKTGRHHLYDDHNLALAAQHLESAEVVQSFNGKNFDVPIIEGLMGRKLILPIHLDLYELISDALNRRGERRKGNTLSEVSERSLGESKPLSGALAPSLADAGRWAELFDYCIGDVDKTTRLFQFAREHGGIVGGNGDILPLALPSWFTPTSNKTE